MKRDIERDLLAWKNSPNHLPIILRGARQVGKTYVVREFGKTQFQNYVEVNFEFESRFHACFETLNPLKIIAQIEILLGVHIVPGETLLFLDEIQDCPNALMALRYFKENIPNLHVIAAGSLLEFIFNEADFRMPVGRVQFFYMKPLSFKEFLVATENQKLRDFIESVNLKDEIPAHLHEFALDLIREYCILGGMPAVIREYLETRSFKKAQDMQSILLTTYQNDFGKYAQGSLINYCRLIFTKAPDLVAKQFKYVQISADVQARELKPALMKLIHAGILHSVYGTTASGLPLNACLNEKKLKLLHFDIGLMKRASYIDLDVLMQKDLFLINQGQLMEQLVGQELLAYQDLLMPPEIYFWARDARGSNAQVDFVANIGQDIIPIEVKSGSSYQMKSLKMLMEENALIQKGLKVSMEPLGRFIIKAESGEKEILAVPLYLLGELSRWLTKKI